MFSWFLHEVTMVLRANDGNWKQMAEIICSFAEGISRTVLLQAGFKDPSPQEQWFRGLAGPFTVVLVDETVRDRWSANSLIHNLLEGTTPDYVPNDCFRELQLMNVPATLSVPPDEEAKADHILVFGEGRVLDWNSKYNRPNRVMEYNETARFVIFWLAEKILQIIRKNSWDRISTLPDLYDRLHTFFQTPNCYILMELQEGEGHKQCYADRWGFIRARSMKEAAARTGMDVIDVEKSSVTLDDPIRMTLQAKASKRKYRLQWLSEELNPIAQAY